MQTLLKDASSSKFVADYFLFAAKKKKQLSFQFVAGLFNIGGKLQRRVLLFVQSIV